jgi:hypothetical protein
MSYPHDLIFDKQAAYSGGLFRDQDSFLLAIPTPLLQAGMSLIPHW